MATVSIGPGGTSIQGLHQCTNNNLLADQGNPLGSLIDTLTEQRIVGMTVMKYPEMGQYVDRVMPTRASTSTRVNGVKTYRTTVGYDGLLNSAGVIDITPSTGTYNNPVSLLDACGQPRSKNIASSANVNAEACNPLIDGPMPHAGREENGRVARATRLPIPPLCFDDFIDKENFHQHLKAILDSVNDACVARFSADQLRWIISKTRFNAAPVQQDLGNGRARLPVDDDLFTSYTFGRVPQHWGSANWMAGMLRLSEIDPRQNLTVHLPTSIFEEYKKQLIQEIGINVQEGARGLTSAVNGFIRDIQNDTLIYTDRVYGRRISFMSTMEPCYVEVEETSTGGGGWYFQEPTIFRDSETAGQIMARNNPNWGVACSCDSRTLCAIVSVTADDVGGKPFYKEPLPNDNPDTMLNSLIDRYARGKGATVNTTLGQMYPSSVETTIFTGLEAQVWMLDPINRRYREAGWLCDSVVSNIKSTWIGGFCEVGMVFAEHNPRSLVNFLLRVPVEDTCVDLSVPCAGSNPVDAALAFDPVTREIVRQTVTTPEPPEVEAPAAGEVYVVGRITTITAPCTGTRTINVTFRRTGGTAGAITITVTGTPTAHGGTPPGSLVLADGDESGVLTWTIPAWVASPQEVESYTLTFASADMTEDGILTRKICIKSAVSCATDCEPDAGCGSC